MLPPPVIKLPDPVNVLGRFNLFIQVFEDELHIADYGHVNANVFAYFRRVDINMDYMGVGAKSLTLAVARSSNLIPMAIIRSAALTAILA